MRVLLVNTNTTRLPQTVLPLGVCLVASATAAAGHQVQVCDLQGQRAPEATLQQAIHRHRPDIIGLSIRNLDTGDYLEPHSPLPALQRLTALCRQQASAPLILGGPAVSILPRPLLAALGGTLAVVGDGETAFPRLLQALEHGDNPTTCPGVVSPLSPHATPNVPETITHLPEPDLAHWLPLQHYRACDAALPVQTKRGCALRCSYCIYPQIEGATFRLRDPARVAAAVQRGRRYGFRHVEFVDSVFGLPQDHAIACCDAIARAPTLPLSTMDLHPQACTPALLQAMRAAGFTAVGISAESASDRMLARLRKDYAAQDLYHAADALRALPAAKIWLLLLGTPGETVETVRETVRFIESLPSDNLVAVTCGVRVLPETALHRALCQDDTLSPDRNLLEPTYYHSHAITPGQIFAMLAACRFPAANLISLHDAGHRLLPAVQRLGALLRVAPPYWRHLPTFNRLRTWIGG